jgi:hypothetical protein
MSLKAGDSQGQPGNSATECSFFLLLYRDFDQGCREANGSLQVYWTITWRRVQQIVV